MSPNSEIATGGASSASKEESKINWSFLPYIKELATKGKLSQADFLLCGNESFLKEAILTV